MKTYNIPLTIEQIAIIKATLQVQNNFLQQYLDTGPDEPGEREIIQAEICDNLAIIAHFDQVRELSAF